METEDPRVGKWSIRYRFYVSHILNSPEKSLSFTLGGRPFELVALEGAGLNETTHVALHGHGFETEELAYSFAVRLRNALALGAAEIGKGVDLGDDQQGATVMGPLADNLREMGADPLSDVHGVQVYRFTGNEFRLQVKIGISVPQDTKQLISAVDAAMGVVGSRPLSEDQSNAARLIALARMPIDPLASATLHIAAVELLASREFTPRQKKLKKDLAAHFKNMVEKPDGLDDDDKEILHLIRDRHPSVARSVTLMMRRLGFSEADIGAFKKEVYKVRSDIFHGEEVPTRDRINSLHAAANRLCPRVVLTALRAGTT